MWIVRVSMWNAAALMIMMATGAIGCGAKGPAAHPIVGQVQLAGGDVKLLSGHSVEAVLESDPLVRAYGAIAEDGGFALETYQAGVTHKGAFDGKYRVRIVFSDDDPDRREQARAAIDAKFLDFEGSGLTFESPSVGPVTFHLTGPQRAS